MSSMVKIFKELPPRLEDICIQYIIEDLSSICQITTPGYSLYEDIVLPKDICHQLIQAYQMKRGILNDESAFDKFAVIFQNKEQTSLSSLNLNISQISEKSLSIFLEHDLESLDMLKCYLRPRETILRNSFGTKLKSLILGRRVSAYFDTGFAEAIRQLNSAPYLRQLVIRGLITRRRRPVSFFSQVLIHNASYLQKLVVHKLMITERSAQSLLSPLLILLPKLRYLDLSYYIEADILFKNVEPSRAETLRTLILHNARSLNSVSVIDELCKLKNLEVLDISQNYTPYGSFDEPDQVLSKIIESLPKLTSLDISGTNLAGTGVPESGSEARLDEREILGLSGRSNPFCFLGLYKTEWGACKRRNIPAISLSGDASVSQLLTALSRYIDRLDVAERALADLYFLIRDDHPTMDISEILTVVLSVLNRNCDEFMLQIKGSAVIFLIVRAYSNILPTVMKRAIITTSLDALEQFPHDTALMRNLCLIFMNFNIPDDIRSNFRRFSANLIGSICTPQDSFVLRTFVILLIRIASGVGERDKNILGDLGVIHEALKIVQRRLNYSVYNDVIEDTWSLLWNVLLDCPANREIFLKTDGLTIFIECFNKFAAEGVLIENMLGTVAVIAEHKENRYHLMTEDFISIMYRLSGLDPLRNDPDVNFLATAVLVLLTSDGPEMWRIANPSWESVLNHIVEAVDRWELERKTEYHYLSLSTILHLLGEVSFPHCHYWAVWTLSNISLSNPKYFHLLETEGAKEIIKTHLERNDSYAKSKALANTFLERWRTYKDVERISELISSM